MARFGLSRDIELFNTISSELVDDVVGTSFLLFKLSVNSMKVNIYGEAITKIYKTAVELNGLIERDDTSRNYDEFGSDTTQNVEFRMNRIHLKEKNVYPEVGDVIYHNDSYFEIYNVRDDQYIGGRTGRNNPNERFSIVCQTTMVRRTQLTIEEPQL